jgi:hypothetical protein
MIKLKSILSEGYAWEREAGKPLPTLAQTTAAHAAKLAEQSAEQAISNPMETPLKESDDIFDEIAGELGISSEEFDEAANKSMAELDIIEKIYMSDHYTSSEALSMIADMLDVDINEAAPVQAEQVTKSLADIKTIFEQLKQMPLPESAKLELARTQLSTGLITLIAKSMGGAGTTKGMKFEPMEPAISAMARANSIDAVYQILAKVVATWNGTRVVDETAKPDYIDADGDGNEAESMKQAFADKEDMTESFNRRLMGNLKGSEHILTETFKRK